MPARCRSVSRHRTLLSQPFPFFRVQSLPELRARSRCVPAQIGGPGLARSQSRRIQWFYAAKNGRTSIFQEIWSRCT